MLRLRNWALLAVAVALALTLTASRSMADDAKKADSGGVSGTVTGSDDKPIAGVLVRVFPPMNKGEKKAGKGNKPVPVATATSDSDGKFEMKDVPVGDYTLQAQVKGQGSAHEKIEVKSGEVTKQDLKLQHKSANSGASSGGDKSTDNKSTDSK